MLLLIAVSLGWAFYSEHFKWLWLSGGLLLILFLSGTLSLIIHRLWMKLGHYLGRVTTPLILGLFYYLLLSPLALLSRLRRKDPLKLKNNNDSLFNKDEKLFVPADFENPW